MNPSQSDTDLEIETYGDTLPVTPTLNQPRASRLRKVRLTVDLEYILPEGGNLKPLIDNLEEIGRTIVTSEGLTTGADAEVDIRAFGVKEISA